MGLLAQGHGGGKAGAGKVSGYLFHSRSWSTTAASRDGGSRTVELAPMMADRAAVVEPEVARSA
jgi:hypothetical protein